MLPSMNHPQVVRVFATTQRPDYDCPWQARPPASKTGSGVLVRKSQILTGAHVVANATFLRVQRIASPTKATAHVLAVYHDCDLALLQVEDPDFLDDVTPAEIGELASRGDKVSVVGFPVGGEEISVTEGVVSRVEVQRYSHSQRQLLSVTIDAAINKGNSGGPVFREGKIAGIAFQKLANAENVGEMVPAPLIRRFLEGVRNKKPPGLPGLGIATQKLENTDLRRYVGMERDQSGVLIAAVEHGGSGYGTLEVGDALLSVDGLPIANNGTVPFEQFRTRYDVILGNHDIGDTIGLEILRNKKRLELELELKPMVYLVPRSQYDRAPSYFVYGGLVFQTLTRNFLATWEKWWQKAPVEFLNFYYLGSRCEDRQEVIVLSQVLADEINVGYTRVYNESVISLADAVPQDMASFVRGVVEAKDTVRLKTSSGSIIVLHKSETDQANARILKRYHIPADRSADL